MDLGLTGKTALVTGGSYGIGLAIALALTREGCKVHIASRELKRLQAAHDISWDQAPNPSIFGDQSAIFSTHQFDALDPALVQQLAHHMKLAGGVDILINNVGGGGRWGSIDPFYTSQNVWDDVYQKNARTAVQLSLALVPAMTARRWGRVVTISSIHGREAGGRPWFAMAKAAEVAMMKSLATTVPAEAGVTFNTVAPGFISIKGKDAEPSRGTPEDVAAAVVFLCSKQARHINGACLVVDGGEGKAF